MKLKKISYAKYGYIFSMPFVLAFLIFSLYPIVYTIMIGFTDLKGVAATTWSFLADPLQNFRDLLNTPAFIISLKNTFFIWILNFIPQILLALLLAVWFTNDRLKIKGSGFFKVIFYMPNIITAASVAILFASLFAYPTSPMNDLLMKLGTIDAPFNFLRSKIIAQSIVAFIQFWMWYGVTMIVLIAGINGISPTLFEAAAIDGANNRQTFFYVTLPALRTILLYTLVTSMIGGMQMFDIPRLFVLNQGPDQATLTTSNFIYNQAFSGSYMFNRAAAASVIMFLIIAVLSAILFWIMRDKEAAREAKIYKQVERAYKQKMRRQKAEGRAN